MKKTNLLIVGLDNYSDQHTKQHTKQQSIYHNSFGNNTLYTDNSLLFDILSSSEMNYYNGYNSPFFSGMFDIMPNINDNISYFDTEKQQKHMEENQEEKIFKESVRIHVKIDTLADLIHLCDTYPLADNIEYNINMKSLHNIKPSLVELQSMIGMKSIKENIVDQILYFVQDLHKISPNNSDYMHTVIYGPPGTGKTEVAKVMGKIFSNLGMLTNKVFKKVTRDDLVAGYLGQTALKTKEVIKECIGGVLFIDEAYSLGNKEKTDSFSKESIDIICEALSDHKKDLMCIIAGYEKELHECFFSYNPGLESRFTWKFQIDEYSGHEMRLIFEKMVNDNNWSLLEPLSDEWFDENKKFFSYYGRDMETLFSKVKIVHSKRVFCLEQSAKTKISNDDMENGLIIYKKMNQSEKKQNERERLSQIYNTLYC
jgi:SpoVK/Ycf46/Vps4 family AAA+-type ATPase